MVVEMNKKNQVTKYFGAFRSPSLLATLKNVCWRPNKIIRISAASQDNQTGPLHGHCRLSISSSGAGKKMPFAFGPGRVFIYFTFCFCALETFRNALKKRVLSTREWKLYRRLCIKLLLVAYLELALLWSLKWNYYFDFGMQKYCIELWL